MSSHKSQVISELDARESTSRSASATRDLHPGSVSSSIRMIRVRLSMRSKMAPHTHRGSPVDRLSCVDCAQASGCTSFFASTELSKGALEHELVLTTVPKSFSNLICTGRALPYKRDRQSDRVMHLSSLEKTRQAASWLKSMRNPVRQVGHWARPRMVTLVARARSQQCAQ